MEVFESYLMTLNSNIQKERLTSILSWIQANYPQLEPKIAWNQPMFTDHETFIIGFSASKKHISIAPEPQAITHFQNEIEKAKYEYTKGIIRVPLAEEMDYSLLRLLIDFNIAEKANCMTFWRK